MDQEPAGFPFGLRASERVHAEADVKITKSDCGEIKVAPDGTEWLETIDNNGARVCVQIAASPEVSMEVRRARLEANRDLKASLRELLLRPGQIQDKLNALIEYVLDATPE